MPFNDADLTSAQQAYNTSMASVMTGVQWIFDDITNYLNLMEFRRNEQTGFDAVKKMFTVCGILRNAHTCLHESATTAFFGVKPPSIHDYFS